MNRIEFTKFMDIPCRFRLRGGKEIYGVIVEKPSLTGFLHYFTTKADREKSPIIGRSTERQLTPVELEDIVMAEPLS